MEHSAQHIDVTIYDAMGRLVRTLYGESSIENQEAHVVWLGDDDSGNELPAGVYLCCLTSKNQTAMIKVIKIDCVVK
jgi:flagellar hook assembly protein FlgD